MHLVLVLQLVIEEALSAKAAINPASAKASIGDNKREAGSR
ncbi:hypothetical protein N8I74_01750 [Chitiniphilus purpureus]|uniref:Uncharacterized protein n=1 Tax=Chitiniphilus purpureus TaxID=2981137 RepID=A0ABY6DN27_9NEIS|nr:hypothetical protein [Chitiniphilus sp. CD1]UXY15765.1 hypothetical protein N8I74_01750 [Chitiniphilus sp. CD1]